MDQELIEELIRVLLLFAIEAYEHEDEPDEAIIKNIHSINVRSLRSARSLVKKLEKKKVAVDYFVNEINLKRKLEAAIVARLDERANE